MNPVVNLLELVISPPLATQLFEHGIAAQSTFSWRRYDGDDHCVLNVTGADPLSIYTIEMPIPEGVRLGYQELPAYTAQDLLKCIPEPLVATDMRGSRQVWTVCADSLFRLPQTEDSNLPNACAKMLLHLVKASRASVDWINNQLTAVKTNR